MTNVTIIGAKGFIGRHLSSTLINEGYNVTAFDRNKTPEYESCRNIVGHFNDINSLEPALEGCDIMVHLVHSSLPLQSNEQIFKDAQDNILNTIASLDLAVKHNVKKVVFVSSGGMIYGYPANQPISEQTSTPPMTAYGVSKLAIEHYLQLYHQLHGLDYTILRVANPYGATQTLRKDHGVISIFIEKALAGKPLDVWGDGTTVRDYLHINDLIAALVKTLTYQGPFHIFNIGSGIGHSLNQILSILESTLGKPITTHYNIAKQSNIPQNVLDIRLARKELNWHPTISLYQGITSLIDYYTCHAQ